MRLLLVRHGQTPSNVRFLLDTAVPGPGLTELGERQAAALPEALAGEDIDALYASTLTRAQLTAAPLAGARGPAYKCGTASGRWPPGTWRCGATPRPRTRT